MIGLWKVLWAGEVGCYVLNIGVAKRSRHSLVRRSQRRPHSAWPYTVITESLLFNWMLSVLCMYLHIGSSDPSRNVMVYL